MKETKFAITYQKKKKNHKKSYFVFFFGRTANVPRGNGNTFICINSDVDSI